MKEQNMHLDKDFDKYVYFASKAKNYTIIFEPRVEILLASGDKTVGKDDESGKLLEGHRIEFHNHMKRYEKTEENKKVITFLKLKATKESEEPESKRMLIEVTKPIKLIKETEVDALINEKTSEKDTEIKRLKKLVGEPVEGEESEEDLLKSDSEKEEGNKKDEQAPF